MEAVQTIDIQILLFIQEHLRIRLLNPLWIGISFLGNAGWFWLALGLLLFLLPDKYRPLPLRTQAYKKAGIYSLLSIAIGFLITNVVLKNTIARIRPYNYCAALIPLVTRPADYSFPSGHTTASFAAALVLSHHLQKKSGTIFAILASLIALSRLYVGVHYPTDVLGGFLVGLLSSVLVNRFSDYRSRK